MELKTLHEAFLASRGVSTDTRRLEKGQIFFALRGENFDGNAFIDEALSAGCSLAVCDDQKRKDEYSVLVVDSVLETLQNLAQYHRRYCGADVLAITGSNGKTTTKELVAAVLSTTYPLICTEGNLNNHIGVPLTLLRLRKEKIAVIEMGANHPGEIARLCEIAEPRTGIITNIGKAHLEGFGSLEGVKKAKGELYDYLAANSGRVICNRDDDILMHMASSRNLKGISYAIEEKADVTGRILNADAGISAEISDRRGKSKLKSMLYGKYNFMNILAAAAVGFQYDIVQDKCIRAIESYRPSNNRSQFIQGKSNFLVMDAYNANPSSMIAALEEFSSTASSPSMVILGEMKELGEESENEHLHIMKWLGKADFDEVLLIGDGFVRHSYKKQYNYKYFNDIWECKSFLEDHPVKGYRILLKGSRKNKLEEVSKILLNY